MKHVTSLMREALVADGVELYEAAPGIYVLSQKRLPNRPMNFKVSWDPERWKLGAKNPQKRFLQVSFEYLTGKDFENGESLIGFLQNVLTPYQKGLEFHPHPKSLKINSVDFQTYQSCIN